MLLSEDEAKERWCPEARVSYLHETAENGVTASTYNRTWNGYELREARCLGSKCMAWRWINPAIGRQTHGYCGKAGPL
jgi:hypothetical protein